MKINKIVFAGTPEFAIPALKILINNGYTPQLVITQPDKMQGRKKRLTAPIVKQFALENDIEVSQPEDINSEEMIDIIAELKPDLFITAAYGGYIGRQIRKIPRFAVINIHPSLLPRFRGATPVNAALWAGDTATGVSIFRLVAKMDAGPLLWQQSYQIKEDDNYTILLDKLSETGAKGLLEVIKQYENNTVTEQKQDGKMATFCVKLEKSDLIINWSATAEEIYNQVRALAVKPGAKTLFRSKPIKVISCRLTDEISNESPGTVLEIIKLKGIKVATGKGVLMLTQVQPAGKKIMSAYDFNLGARVNIGEKFENT